MGVGRYTPRQENLYYCTGGWVGFRVGLDGCGKTRPHRHSIPGPSSPYRIDIQTELPRPSTTYILVEIC